MALLTQLLPPPGLSLTTTTLTSYLTPLLRARNLLRLLAVLYALLNLKSLPLVWHVRILYHALRNLRSHAASPTTLTLDRGSRKPDPGQPNTIHPIFATHTLTTHTPLLETDYNLHKSNSTYFTDLDASRSALVFALLSPGFRSGNAELGAQGHVRPGARFVVVLGSVHASFRREVRPYERYQVRSRLVAWDAKWLVIGSWFVRPLKTKKKKTTGSKDDDDEVEVLASALSKYVVKKGRFTVSPERCLRHAGLLPPEPEKKETPGKEGGDADREGVVANGHVVDGDGLTATAVPLDAFGKVVELDNEVTGGVGITAPGQQPDADASTCTTEAAAAAEWTWDQIEQERLRGLDLVKGWLALDGELLQEFSRVPGS